MRGRHETSKTKLCENHFFGMDCSLYRLRRFQIRQLIWQFRNRTGEFGVRRFFFETGTTGSTGVERALNLTLMSENMAIPITYR